MNKEAVEIDEEHEFTGVTIRVVSVSGIKSELDGGQIFVKIRCNDKSVSTRKKMNDRATIIFEQNFFYNTTQILDDDIVFELYTFHEGQGASKNLTASKAANSKSKLNEYEGKLLGATKQIQISRMNRQKQQKAYELMSSEGKIVGKVTVGYDYLERQDIVGGIKCPNLSLKPENGAVKERKLTLQNKYAKAKNLYSFLDGNDTPNCEFFPKKFHH